ncbi:MULTISPECIES: hypothetical protein [Streptomyces]|nr:MULTISPECIES: hypothetical protein [Streptomyces]NNG89161.1 hypothetical protein [Streptomyces cacaoi]
MAKNKKQDRRRAQEQSRTADEQTQQREQARNDTAERTPSPADVARKGRERRFGHN